MVGDALQFCCRRGEEQMFDATPGKLPHLRARHILAATFSSGLLLGAAAVFPAPNPFFAASFTVQTDPVTFGQAPSWTRDGRVLSSMPDGSGVAQVYVSALDGSDMRCLTC